MSDRLYGRVGLNLMLACAGFGAPVFAARQDPAYLLSCMTSVAQAANLQQLIQAQLLEVLAQPLRNLGVEPRALEAAWNQNRFLGTSNTDVFRYLEATRGGQSAFCNGSTVGECRRRILTALFPDHNFREEVLRTEFLELLEGTHQVLFLTVLLGEDNQMRFAYRELIRDLMANSELSVLLYTNSSELLLEFPRIEG
ncbi:MAG: hypothetical protein R3B54_02000 [Bdellovibrionota bacterium]